MNACNVLGNTDLYARTHNVMALTRSHCCTTDTDEGNQRLRIAVMLANGA